MPSALAVLVSVLVPAALAVAGGAPPCTSPADLCTGDPCVTRDLTVPARCVLDFRPRRLVIRGTMTVPAGGVLSLTANDIEIRGGVIGQGDVGPSITFTATRDIAQYTRVASLARSVPGSVTLRAGRDLRVFGNPTVSSAYAPGAPGGTLTLEAGGVVSCPGCQIGARARGAAGTVLIRGAAGVDLPLGSHLDAGGTEGGLFLVDSLNGPVFIETDVRAAATSGLGGMFIVRAATTVTLNRDITMDGGTGGSISVIGDDVVVHGPMQARGKTGGGGAVQIAGYNVTVDGTPHVDGETAGGALDVGGNTVRILGGASARPGGLLLFGAEQELDLDGVLRVGSDGCIAASAPTTSTGGASPDVPLATSCP